MKCKDCIKWLDKEKHANGVLGKCTKHKFWCNENYFCKYEVKHDRSSNIECK